MVSHTPRHSPEVIIYGRTPCELCDRMWMDLGQHFADLQPNYVDIAGDPGLERRFGLRIPVLEVDGEVVCFGRLDPDRLRRALARD